MSRKRTGSDLWLSKIASKSYARKAGASITTRVRLKRVSDGWRLIFAERDKCFVNQPEQMLLTVSRAAHADILNRAMRGISVQELLDDS